MPGDDDTRLAWRDLLDQVHHLPHRRGLADETDAGVDLPEAPAKDLHLVLDVPLLERALQDDLEAGRIERLLDEIEDAFAHRFDGRIDADERGLWRFLAKRARERQAVELRHDEIADDHVRVQLGNQLQGVMAVARLLDLVAPALEQLTEDFARGGIVVDHQDARFHVSHGDRFAGGHWDLAAALSWVGEREREACGRRRREIGRELG